MKEKLSDLLLDIGKYIITVVVISSLFANFERFTIPLYCVSVGITLVFIGIGLAVAYWNDKTKKRKE